MSGSQNKQYPDWLSSTLASDATEGKGILPLSLHPVNSNSRVIGPAFVALGSQDDNQVIRRLVENPPPSGFVLIVAGHQTSRTATIGGLMALELQNLGFLGVITEGLVRDSQEIKRLDIPVWCRGSTPAASAKANPGIIGDPVIIGDVVINQDDLIIADDDGIVVWPQDNIDQLIVKAKKKLDSDKARMERLTSAKK
jgi:regulator of RNase E activity RraA